MSRRIQVAGKDPRSRRRGFFNSREAAHPVAHYRKFVSEFPVLEIESANESSRRRQVQFVQPLIINIEQKHASRMTAIQQDEGKPCPA
jgi:hypothetical protein